MPGRRFLTLAIALLASCSSRPVEEPVAVAPNLALARFPAFAPALSRAAALTPVTGGFEVRYALEDGALVRPTGALRITLPDHADGALRVATFVDANLWIEVKPRNAAHAPARVEGKVLRMLDAASAVEEIYFASHDRAEEVRVLPRATRTELAWELAKGPSVGAIRVRGDIVEVLDRKGSVRLMSEPLFAVDAVGTRRSLSITLEGLTLRATLDARDLVAPIAVDPAWTAAGALPFPTSGGTVAMLTSGKLLYSGGYTTSGESVNAATYDPGTDTWKAVGTMKTARRGHLLAVLPSGQVLAVGAGLSNSTAEKYDPTTETWAYVKALTYARGMGGGAVLPSGKVLIADGGLSSGSSKPAPAELYDPVADTWTVLRPPNSNLHMSRAIALPSGKVAFVDADRGEVYDPATNTWALGSTPSFVHYNTEFVGLGGMLYALGGFQSTSSRNSEIERFDPTTLTFAHVGRLTTSPAVGISAVALASGKILALPNTTTTNLFDPATGITRYVGRPIVARTSPTLARLAGDKVLVIGGSNSSLGGYLSTSEVWSTPTGALGSTCVAADDCASLFCVDGVCCNSPCGGECTSCALPGTLGTCSPVASGDDPRGICEGECVLGCRAGTCTYLPKGASCGAEYCSKGKLEVGTCSGYGSSCIYTASQCAGGFLCQDSTSCKKGCSSPADCATGPCDLTTGTCTDYVFEAGPDTGPEPVLETGPLDTGAPDTGTDTAVADTTIEDTSVVVDTGTDTEPLDTGLAVDAVAPPPQTEGGTPIAPPVSEVGRCTTGADCPTGFCADGVCCDRPCNERCYSCALPGSLGRCTPSPAGVDLRSECGAPLDCIGTCDGRGFCTGASKGTQCARAQCTGDSKGSGAAYCSAPGVRCPTLTAPPFDCAPFACDPVFGACHSRCASSEQCATGHICDVPSQMCVAPPPPPEEGCSLSGGPGRRATSASALLLVAAVLLLRRRSAIAALAAATASCSAKTEVPPRTDGSSVLRTVRAFDAIAAQLPAGGGLQRFHDGYRLSSDRTGPAFRPAGQHALDVTLPLTIDGATRIAVPRDPDVWIAIAAEGDARVTSVPAERTVIGEGAARDTDVVLVAAHDRFEDLRLLHTANAPTTTRYRMTLGAGVSTLRLAHDRVEVVDLAGKVRFRSEPAFAVDTRGTRRALAVTLTIDGREATLTTALDAGGLVYPVVVDPTFSALPNPIAVHSRGQGLLVGGKAMFLGGRGPSGAHSVVESYDPTSDTWTTLAPMLEPRDSFVLGRLPSGDLIVAGGNNTASGGLSTGERYNVATNTWTAIAPMSVRRDFPGGVMLNDGRLLVAGGGYNCGLFCGALYSTGETYNATSNTWSAAGTMQIARSSPHLHKLASGKVLAVHDGGNNIALADLFDPASSTWSIAPNMPASRRELLSATLASGKVAVFGGAFAGARTDIYDGVTNTWTQVADMIFTHNNGSATILPSGMALLAGDTSSGVAQLYDPVLDKFVRSGSHAANLDFAPTVLLPSGQVVFAGAGSIPAELWSPPVAIGAACIEGGDCASGNCVDGVCCSVASCATGLTCASAVAKGTCKKISGQSCATSDECGSGSCVDGVCCTSACTGACRACNLGSSRGICVPIDEGPDPRGTCPDGACGSCKAGACVRRPAGTLCGTTCSGSTITVGRCLADGTCDRTTEPCAGSLVCANATSCRTNCSTSTDCTTSACSAGSCEIGAIPDATPADGASLDATPDTAPTDSGTVPTDSGTIDSASSDTEPVDTSIEDSTVPDTSPIDSSTADTAIATDSTSSPDTAEEEVNVAAPQHDGGKPTLPASIQRCTRDEECSTGHCADGVCCDTACGDRCYSCAQLDSPGTCKVLPAGVDLRGECGPIGTCVATCNGKGSCVGAGNGTQCAQQRCTGKAKGVGPAYCPGRGAACPVGDGVPFECGPYVCEPLFGACTTTCLKSSECADGHVCDVASKQCLPVPAPAEEESGCSTSSRPTHGYGAVALLALALAMTRRRSTSS